MNITKYYILKFLYISMVFSCHNRAHLCAQKGGLKVGKVGVKKRKPPRFGAAH